MGKWGGPSRRQMGSAEEDVEALGCRQLAQSHTGAGAALLSLRAKLALSQLLWVPLPRAREGGRKNFHCPEVNRQK